MYQIYTDGATSKNGFEGAEGYAHSQAHRKAPG